MKRNWVRVLGWIAVLLSLAIIGGILWRSAGQLRDLDWRQFLLPGLVGLGLYGISLALQASVWTGLMSKLSLSSWSWQDVQVYIATHLTRRLPGLPWYMAGRMIAYERGSRRSTAAVFATAIEWGGMFIAGGVWVIVGRLEGASRVFAIAGLAALLVAVYLVFRSLSRAEKWGLLTHIPFGWLLLTAASYTCAWILGGLILYCLLRAQVSSTSLMDVTSAWALSGTASMLMVFLPAGLGIRELTLSLLLRPHVGGALALVGALLMRVVFILGDLIWGGIYWLTARSQSSRRPQ